MSKGWKQFERTLLVLLVLLLFVLTGPLRLRSGGGEQSRVTALRTGWYQLSDGGRKVVLFPKGELSLVYPGIGQIKPF